MNNSEQPINPVLGNGVSTSTLYGLTKREYFAGLAMQGMIQSHTLNLSKEEASIIAGQSIQFADELLKQLQHKHL